MSAMKNLFALLAAGGALGAASQAGAATTQMLNISGTGPVTDVDLAGSTTAQFTYGLSADEKSMFTPQGSSMVGALSTTPQDPATDTYSSNSVKTGYYLGDSYLAKNDGQSYLNLQFDANGVSYTGAANFLGTSDAEPFALTAFSPRAQDYPPPGDTVLESVTYQAVSAAPEPDAWMLLIAGVGMAGLALRRGREAQSLASA